jgi:hypothetical protein
VTKAVAAKAWDLPVIGGRRYSAGAPATEPLFAMDYSSGADPLAGWEDILTNAPAVGNFVRTHMPGIGPSGQDGYQIEILPVASGAEMITQWWTEGLYSGVDKGPGDEVFFSWRFRWITARECVMKFVMQHALDNYDESRVGITMEHGLGGSGYRWRGSHGGDQICTTPDYSDWNTWTDVQYSLTFNSVGSSTDNMLKIWKDAYDYNSPTVQSSTSENGGIIPVEDGTSGYYVVFSANTIVPSTTLNYIFQICDFRVTPTFRAM